MEAVQDSEGAMNLLYLRRALERFRSGVGGPLIHVGIAGARLARFCIREWFWKSEHPAERYSGSAPCANEHKAIQIDSDRTTILFHIFGQLSEALTQCIEQLFEFLRMVHAYNSTAEDCQRNGS